MAKTDVYPRGFSLGQLDKEAITNPGDETVLNLALVLLSGSSESKTWNYRKLVLRTAVRLFGSDWVVWAAAQATNPFMSDRGFDVIEDTANFIHNGTRYLPPVQWNGLVPTSDTPSTNIDVEFRRSFARRIVEGFKYTDELNTPNCYLQQWLSKTGGMEDLVMTMLLFFGPLPTAYHQNISGHMSPKNPKLQALHNLLS